VLVPGPWTHRAVSANGVRLHVAVCGAGPLVVLVHGFPQFWWAWRHQLVGLAAAGYRAVAVDVRGCGASDKTPRGYDLWTLAGDVAGLVPALGEERAFVVGHGWGGLVGWTVAALHPRRVRALAVLGAPHPRAARRGALRDGWTGVALGLQPPRWPERRLRHGSGVTRVLAGWSGADWRLSAEFTAAAARYAAAMRVPAAAHCASEPARWAARSQLRAEGRRFAAAVARPTEAPVLALRGTDDPCVTARTLAASAAWTAAGFTVGSLAGVGHFPHEERPGAVTARLVSFLGQ
jgi:pimeloyl-ACP methyl ester carboxylesterase